MRQSKPGQSHIYKPVLFTIGAFLLTWGCVFALESTYLFSYEMPRPLVTLLDFTKSASPLIVALLLLRKQLSKKGFLLRYVFGERQSPARYVVVTLLFLLQFFVFYFFRPEAVTLTAPLFLSTFAGQFFFGGGMEEGGWRGYLFPALSLRMPVLLASAITSVIWSLWHLPYFIIPSSYQYGSNFLAYTFITIMLGFMLSAVYLLTKSVLLCTLFHAFSNTAVMTMQADMSNLALLAAYAALAIVGAVLCQVLIGRESKARSTR